MLVDLSRFEIEILISEARSLRSRSLRSRAFPEGLRGHYSGIMAFNGVSVAAVFCRF